MIAWHTKHPAFNIFPNLLFTLFLFVPDRTLVVDSIIAPFNFIEFFHLFLQAVSSACILGVIVQETLNTSLSPLLQDLLKFLLLAISVRATHDFIHVEAWYIFP